MSELRHLLSQESEMTLRAVQAQSEELISVEMMTRHDLQNHLAIRARLGATEEELASKLEQWKLARDINRIMYTAEKTVRTRERDARRAEILKKRHG